MDIQSNDTAYYPVFIKCDFYDDLKKIYPLDKESNGKSLQGQVFQEDELLPIEKYFKEKLMYRVVSLPINPTKEQFRNCLMNLKYELFKQDKNKLLLIYFIGKASQHSSYYYYKQPALEIFLRSDSQSNKETGIQINDLTSFVLKIKGQWQYLKNIKTIVVYDRFEFTYNKLDSKTTTYYEQLDIVSNQSAQDLYQEIRSTGNSRFSKKLVKMIETYQCCLNQCIISKKAMKRQSDSDQYQNKDKFLCLISKNFQIEDEQKQIKQQNKIRNLSEDNKRKRGENKLDKFKKEHIGRKVIVDLPISNQLCQIVNSVFLFIGDTPDQLQSSK
ncbi:UNKNOWN [Stylonychia lemnae]|uniref:Uncharacterized protein n=1 Tax=Stylonychia lemnae TaxID=5949 RepID=A0A077ZXK4_STYLE|nr:UNKNOWN [Stylonychia lemnae]|eukprot:CDW74291.1 UNKNOWN [Stylonychia lemnae]